MLKYFYTIFVFLTLPLINYAQFTFYEITGAGGLPAIENGAIDTADVDLDGDIDLFIMGKPAGQEIANLYLNDGSGNFTVGQIFVGVQIGHCQFADVDGDGDFDLIYSGQTMAGVQYTALLVNDGTGNFSVSTSAIAPMKESGLKFGDIDGDGDLDLIIAGRTNGSIIKTILYQNDGNGNFSEVMGTPFANMNIPDLTFIDIDGDLDLDLLMTGSVVNFTPTTKMYVNDGSGNFTEQASGILNIAQGEVEYSDVDNDGDFDVLISGFINSSDPKTELYLNNGSGSFSLDLTNTFVQVANSTVSFADIDQDGDEDLVISGWTTAFSEDLKIYENNGSGIFTALSTPVFTGLNNRYSTAVFDHDGDGDLDICALGVPANSGGFPGVYLYGQFTCPDDIIETLTVDDPVLTSDHTLLGATYLWLDCDNFFHSFNNATASIFTPPSNGNYAVRIKQFGCVDTSDCYSIVTVGNSEISSQDFSVYPNPCVDFIKIDGLKESEKYSIFDVSGRLILMGKLTNSSEVIVQTLASGQYVLALENGTNLRFVKE